MNFFPHRAGGAVSQMANVVNSPRLVAQVRNLQWLSDAYDQAFVVNVDVDFILKRKAGIAKPVTLQSDVWN